MDIPSSVHATHLADAGEWGLARLRWRDVLRRVWWLWCQLGTHLTSSRVLTLLGSSLLHFPPHEQHFGPFISKHWVYLPYQRSLLAWISLYSPGVSSSCGFIRRDPGSHKAELCENCPARAHCSPALLPAHSPTAPKLLWHLFHVPSHAWETKEGQMQCFWEAGCPIPLGFFGNSC